MKVIKKTLAVMLSLLLLIVMGPFGYNSVLADSSSITYSGTLNNSETHIFKFTVRVEGKVKIEKLITEETDQSGATYLLVSKKEKGEEKQFEDGDILTPGEYEFSIQTNNSELVKYSYKISNVTFNGIPNTSLPKLDVAYPHAVEKEFRVEKGNSEGKGVAITDGELKVRCNRAFKPVYSEFHGDFKFKNGSNTLAYIATNTAGNAIKKGYHVVVPRTERISSTDTIDTSVNLSKKLHAHDFSSDTVLIAKAGDYTHALTVATLAVKEQAPLLVTTSEKLDEKVKHEIVRRGTKKAIILGDTSSISANVENDLKVNGVTEVERINSNNTVDTSIKIADKVSDDNTSSAIVISNDNYVDGPSASSIAASIDIPVLSTTTNKLSDEVKEFLKKHPNIKQFVIPGSMLPNPVIKELESFGIVENVDGTNQIDTARDMAKHFGMNPANVVLANGSTYADLYPSSVFAALIKAPLLTTGPKDTPEVVESFLAVNEKQINLLYVVGNTTLVSDEIMKNLDAYIK